MAASDIIVVRVKTHGERFELGVWTTRYGAFLEGGPPQPDEGTAKHNNTSSGKRAHKHRKGRRGDSDDSDGAAAHDGAANVVAVPHVSDRVRLTVMKTIVDQKFVFTNAFRRKIASSRLLIRVFGTDDLARIAYHILCHGATVETDTVRHERKAHAHELQLRVGKLVAQGGMLLNRYAGVAPEAADVAAALAPSAKTEASSTSASTSPAAGPSAPDPATYFDEEDLEFLGLPSGPNATGAGATTGSSDSAGGPDAATVLSFGAEQHKRVQQLAEAGVEPWLIAADVAHAVCTDARAGLTDCVRAARHVVLEVRCPPLRRASDSNEDDESKSDSDENGADGGEEAVVLLQRVAANALATVTSVFDGLVKPATDAPPASAEPVPAAPEPAVVPPAAAKQSRRAKHDAAAAAAAGVAFSTGTEPPATHVVLLRAGLLVDDAYAQSPEFHKDIIGLRGVDPAAALRFCAMRLGTTDDVVDRCSAALRGGLTVRIVSQHALTVLDHMPLLEGFTTHGFDVAASVDMLAPVRASTEPQHNDGAHRGAEGPAEGDDDEAAKPPPKPTPSAAERQRAKWARMTHAELQAACKKQGLGVGGKKVDLLQRLEARAAEEDDTQ